MFERVSIAEISLDKVYLRWAIRLESQSKCESWISWIFFFFFGGRRSESDGLERIPERSMWLNILKGLRE